PPLIRSGGRPFWAVTWAPIAVSGVVPRSLGRGEGDAPPAISGGKFCPATIPLSMRIVEPEFPQSRASFGAASDISLPRTSIVLSLPFLRSHFTPSERKHPRVLAQSAPVE